VKPILSVRDLASRLGVKPDRLRSVARAAQIPLDKAGARYSTFPLVEGHKARHLTVPDAELKKLQRRINSNIIAKIPLPPGVYGGVKGATPRMNAEQHMRQPSVINIDVKNFFPNVRHYLVYRMFRQELRFGKEVCSLLTSLTTYRSYLPQGAPTSTGIANLLLAQPVDGPVRAEADRTGIRYTRWVDDIAVSGRDPRRLINFIAKTLSRRRLPIHRYKANGKSKLKIMRSGRAQQVTGLIVNAPLGPSVASSRRDKIRGAIWALRHARKFEVEAVIRSVRGKIGYVARFNPGAARRLTAYLDSTLARFWPAFPPEVLIKGARLEFS
jgi:RNA-directed DNA polymerase